MLNVSLLYSLAVVEIITDLIQKLIVMPSVSLNLVKRNLVKARKGRRDIALTILKESILIDTWHILTC